VYRLSRRFGGPGGGTWGGAKDRFSLTDEGKALAAVLSMQLDDTQGTGLRLPQQGTQAGRAAAAAAGRGGFAEDGDDADSGDDADPFGQFASGAGFLAGAWHTPAAAAAAA
jgi:hypothetical protein